MTSRTASTTFTRPCPACSCRKKTSASNCTSTHHRSSSFRLISDFWCYFFAALPMHGHLARIALRKSKAVSLPASPALASYFLAPQEVTKKRCRATPPALRPGSLRFSPRTAGSELAPFGRSDMRNRKPPSATALLGGGVRVHPARRSVTTSTKRSAATHLPRWRREAQGRAEKDAPHV